MRIAIVVKGIADREIDVCFSNTRIYFRLEKFSEYGIFRILVVEIVSCRTSGVTDIPRGRDQKPESDKDRSGCSGHVVAAEKIGRPSSKTQNPGQYMS